MTRIKNFIFLSLLAIFIISVKSNAKEIDMGEFKLTAYCPCQECSEGYGRKTACQTYAQSDHTIAVDPSVIGYGAKVRIGDDIYIAEDCGGHVCGDHIDIFFDTHEEVEEFGIKHKNVWIVR